MMDSSERPLLEPLLYNAPQRKAAEIVDKFNPKNAKRVALFLMIFFIGYHCYIHFRYGKDSCRWLLSDGRYKRDMGWQPYGCMMHVYSEKDRNQCMRSIAFSGHGNVFTFIGDYRLKNMYEAFHTHFTNGGENSVSVSDKLVLDPFAQQSNQTFSDPVLKLKADFVWGPYISNTVIDLLNKFKASNESPNVIVMGCSTWSIKSSNSSRETLSEYYYNITQLLPIFQDLCKRSRILWVLQAPVNENKLNLSNSMITNEMIDEYNAAAMKALEFSCVELWSSSRLIAEGRIDEMLDGIELSPDSLNTDIQLLLNMYCNDYMNHNDGTCCATTEPVTYIQISAFVFLLGCLICGAFLAIKPLYAYTLRYSGVQTVVISLAKLAIIMMYFYLCDRTNFFMKENKYYSSVSFWLSLCYIFTLGLFFTEDSRYAKILNRDQTDEWKGWMQCVILIYQMTGAHIILPIHNHVLILASAYLFLSGYGHFTYLWFRNDAGLIRMLQILFRLNFLTVVLCFCMNRPYQFYYFVPVVTFWFLLFYVVFILPPRVTSSSSEAYPIQYAYVIFKIMFVFVSICILYMSQVFFEKLFVTRPWKALFVTTDDDIENWWFRWKIDRFSALYGVLFAFVLLLVQKFNLMDDNNHNNLFSARVSFFVAVLAFLSLLATSIYAIICPNRSEFIDIHTYIVIVPIVGYILLRNVSGILRTRYSNMFAFFGRISLELFVSHFHIWLAADSNGVLVLIPKSPVINALVVTYIYVCISHELHYITRKLLPYAVPNNWKVALRNMLIFVLILIPAAIRDGALFDGSSLPYNFKIRYTVPIVALVMFSYIFYLEKDQHLPKEERMLLLAKICNNHSD